MNMNMNDIIRISYTIIFGVIIILFIINSIKFKEVTKKFLGIVILLPLLLRFFGII